MVAIAFVGVAAAAGVTTSTVAGAVFIAAGTALATYIDQQYVYPALFGKKNPKPDALEGFQISTTDPGAPRWEVYGSRAWVPCHYLWSLNIREEVSGGQTGKGGRPFVQQVRADAGIAACDGPIASIDTVYADERPLWSKQFNRVVAEDNRWSIAALAGPYQGIAGTFLRIEATDYDVADFSGLFDAGAFGVADDGNFVRLEGVLPLGLNGYYRLLGVDAHAGNSLSEVILQPLRNQTPATGTAGTIFQPAILRRIDQGCASYTWSLDFTGIAGGSCRLRRPLNDPSIPGLPQVGASELAKVWVVGGVYRFDGFSNNGLYRLLSRVGFFGTGGTGNPNNDYLLNFAPLEGQPLVEFTSVGTAVNPGIITRAEGGQFVYQDSIQGWTEYLGTLSQSQDPTLAVSEPNPPAHRGIAHMSFANWNLAPNYNTFPRLTALVRARSGESVATAIERICLRTMPEEHVDVSQMRQKALVGYSVPGGMTSGQALQPIQIMYGVVMQDRGGVMTFLDERDLPIVAVATRHLNARPAGERTTTRGFSANTVDEAYLPERVVVEYVSPTEGENEAESDGHRSPEAGTRGHRDTLKVNVRPLVAWPYEVKRRARELRRRVRLESVGGQVRLPPGYMDVLPAHCMSFVANNYQEERAPVSATIAYDTLLRDITPLSVRVTVLFANGQRVTLVDNGAGALEGFPAGITTFVNTVDYVAGRIELLCSVALDTATDTPPTIGYLFDRKWLLRANKAVLSGWDFTVTCEAVQTTTDNPLPPVPRELITGLGGAIVAAVPEYRVHVLDIPTLYPGTPRTVQIGLVAGPAPGGQWRGAVVYQSPNGIDHWSAIGQVQAPSVIGTLIEQNLPGTLTGVNPGVVDWTTTLKVDIPNGEILESVPTENLSFGQNWLLVGDEIIAFHEAEAAGGTEWHLRGLVRGLRQTTAAIDKHVVGERVVLLFLLGVFHGLTYTPVGGYTAANRTYHFRFVPGGASIENVATVTTLIRGRSALPGPPRTDPAFLTQKIGSYLQLEWFRRSIDQTSLFGPSLPQIGEVERYEVVAFNIALAVTILPGLTIDQAIEATATQRWTVGGDSTGTIFVHRQIQYDETDFLAHGFILNVTPIGFAVYQVSPAGKSDVSDIVFMTPTT